MTTQPGRFIIHNGGLPAVSIIDAPAGADYLGIVFDAIRNGNPVAYERPGNTEVTDVPMQVKPAPIKALKGADRPAAPRKKIHRRARRTSPATEPVAASMAESVKPTSVEAASRWNKGDVVFLAWSNMSAAQREAYDDMRESMGIVDSFRRGQGIRRTVGIIFDDREGTHWFTPDELSDKCEFCIESKTGAPDHE